MQKTWVRVLTTLMTLGMMVIIFCFSMEPADKSDATSGIIAERLADIFRPEWRQYPAEERTAYFNSVQHLVRKGAHFTEFALLGLSLRLCLESWLGRRRWLWAASWSGGTLYAGLDELHQLLVDGRSGQWTDVLIDSSGVLCGVLVVTIVLRLVRRRQS